MCKITSRLCTGDPQQVGINARRPRTTKQSSPGTLPGLSCMMKDCLNRPVQFNKIKKHKSSPATRLSDWPTSSVEILDTHGRRLLSRCCRPRSAVPKYCSGRGHGMSLLQQVRGQETISTSTCRTTHRVQRAIARWHHVDWPQLHWWRSKYHINHFQKPKDCSPGDDWHRHQVHGSTNHPWWDKWFIAKGLGVWVDQNFWSAEAAQCGWMVRINLLIQMTHTWMTHWCQSRLKQNFLTKYQCLTTGNLNLSHLWLLAVHHLCTCEIQHTYQLKEKLSDNNDVALNNKRPSGREIVLRLFTNALKANSNRMMKNLRCRLISFVEGKGKNPRHCPKDGTLTPKHRNSILATLWATGATRMASLSETMFSEEPTLFRLKNSQFLKTNFRPPLAWLCSVDQDRSTSMTPSLFNLDMTSGLVGHSIPWPRKLLRIEANTTWVTLPRSSRI